MSEKCADTAYLYVYSAGSMSSDKLIDLSVKDFLSLTGQVGQDVNVRILREAKGRPYISEPDGVYISVTHSGEYCIVAVARCRIGVDLQTHDRLKSENQAQACERYSKLSRRFFHPHENEYVSVSPLARFFEVWCTKESYVKYTGEGLDDNFWTYSVLPESLNLQDCRWTKLEVFFSLIPFKKGYTLGLCSQVPVEVEFVYKK